MSKLRHDEELFFQIAFFRCHARRRHDWHDIEVEVTAGDACYVFLFASSVTIGEFKRRTARKILVELRNTVHQLQDYLQQGHYDSASQ